MQKAVSREPLRRKKAHRAEYCSDWAEFCTLGVGIYENLVEMYYKYSLFHHDLFVDLAKTVIGEDLGILAGLQPLRHERAG